MPSAFVACRACPWRANGAFLPWPRDEVLALERFKRDHITVRAGRSIARAARNSDFCTVFSGWAFRYALVNGGRQILNFCLPGDLIGVQAPLLGSASASSQALTDVELCVFHSADFDRMMAEAPFIAAELARIAAAQATAAERRLASVGRRTAEARIAHLLLDFYERLQALGMAGDGVCILPLTLEHLADALGLSHVHVSRMLKVLNEDGLARFERGELTVLDMKRLRLRAHVEHEPDRAKAHLF